MRNGIVGLTVAFAMGVTMASASAGVDNWPSYRGPHFNGHADVEGLPTEWSETKNVKWKTEIHGKAWSSPVIWGDQIWMTTATADGKVLSGVCVDRDSGKIVYDEVLFNIAEPQFCIAKNSYASPSPVIEEGRVYLNWGSPGTACIDTKTMKVLWTRDDLKCNHFRAPGSSPVLYKNLLILTMDGSDYQYAIALDKNTGKTVWRQDRTHDYADIDPKTGMPKADGDFRKGFATPLIITVDGKDQLISPAAKAVHALDPMTGKPIWYAMYNEHSPSSNPLFYDGLVIVKTGWGKAGIVAVKPTGSGNVTDTHVAWSIKSNSGNAKKPSAVIVDGLMYMVSDQGGIATCLDAKTGDEVWKTRLGGKEYSASVLYAGGLLYFFSEEGEATVVKPGRDFNKVAENKLDEGLMASPAVAGKALFLRTKTHLYRIEN
ncbi:MAG: PQQ-binding-like beta-propeller repeat protein [Phycisphaera sp.]|nr:PQQ-binding-like beta-propeller repeat protein [Phycisphaera sp.]